MKFPKWKYRKDPTDGKFQSTLVGNAKAEEELGPSWTDDPHEHGIEVVPYPAELSPGGQLMHHAHTPDANGNFAYGPPPTAAGIGGSLIGRKG
jgi:hypothetical protein